MNIQLPNGQKHALDDNITIQEKLKVVEDLTNEFMDVIELNFDSNSVRYFLDSLANYLVWHKEPEDKGTEDKEILSVKKMEKLVKFKKTSKTINFTDLNKKDSYRLFGEGGGNE